MESSLMEKEEYVVILLNKYADMVLRLALAHLGNLADAQDVCQEVYIKLLKNQRSFKDKEHEKAWIIRVTINTCRDVHRSPWRKWFSPVEEVPLPIDQSNNSHMEIMPFVLSLPQKYRVVIHLYYYEGYKTAEMAELLNRKEGTIRTQLKRAKELLKSKMAGGVINDDNS
ncbi:RNA polymerase sigma factor [Paenibacillus sp. GCM10027627]|uniref:RNA polymerase sigma factor n=1 Tax=unclassified Paenibacillus TaxID=185978 RepID=UPI00362BC671